MSSNSILLEPPPLFPPLPRPFAGTLALADVILRFPFCASCTSCEFASCAVIYRRVSPKTGIGVAEATRRRALRPHAIDVCPISCVITHRPKPHAHSMPLPCGACPLHTAASGCVGMDSAPLIRSAQVQRAVEADRGQARTSTRTSRCDRHKGEADARSLTQLDNFRCAGARGLPWDTNDRGTHSRRLRSPADSTRGGCGGTRRCGVRWQPDQSGWSGTRRRHPYIGGAEDVCPYGMACWQNRRPNRRCGAACRFRRPVLVAATAAREAKAPLNGVNGLASCAGAMGTDHCSQHVSRDAGLDARETGSLIVEMGASIVELYTR